DRNVTGVQTCALPICVLHCDVGWADFERPGGSRSGDLPFLVTAGMGRSGATVQATPGWAKDRLGAAGYGIGALGQLGASHVPLTDRKSVVQGEGRARR